jgi:hypothetical protein
MVIALGLVVSLASIIPAMAASTAATSASPDKDKSTIGTATVFAEGAEIHAHITQDFTISPLHLYVGSTPSYPIAGDRVLISVSVSNSGTIAAERVLPWLVVTSGTALVSPLSGPAPASAARIEPGKAAVFSWTCSITATGAIELAAGASGTLAGGQNILVIGRADYALTSPTVAQLASMLTPNPVQVIRGQWFILDVTVSNTGGVTARGVLPSLQPTAGAELVAMQSGPVPAEPVSLRPGAWEQFRFTFSANGSGIVSFSTTVSGTADLAPPGLLARASTNAAEKAGKALRKLRDGATRFKERIKLMVAPPPPPRPEEIELVGFERAIDLMWDTGGYVQLALAHEHVTEGERSLEAVFLRPASLDSSTSGAFRPSLRRTAPARGTLPPLAPTDWGEFTALRADCYNPGSQKLDLHMTVVDVRGFSFAAIQALPAQSATTIEISIVDARQARLDVARISELRLGIDTSALDREPTVYFDNLRFRMRPAALSVTVSQSSSVPADSASSGPSAR